MPVESRSMVIVLAAAALALLPALAAAGGWVVVTLDGLPEQVAAGEPQAVGFTVRQHGERPIGGQKGDLLLVHRGSGEQVVAPAVDDGPVGHYVARFTLPQAGWWDWKVRMWSEHPMPALWVLPAASKPVGVGAGAPVYAETPSTGTLPLLAAAAAAGLSLSMALILRRWRARERAPTGGPVPPGTVMG